MKNILLTGGAGYIGSHVANFLLDKGICPLVEAASPMAWEISCMEL